MMTSDVLIACENVIADKIEKICEKNDFAPSVILSDEDGSSKIFQWIFAKWDSEYQEVKDILNILDDADNHVGEAGYGYKLIRITEDNTTVISENSRGQYEFDGVYPIMRVEIPENFQQQRRYLI